MGDWPGKGGFLCHGVPNCATWPFLGQRGVVTACRGGEVPRRRVIGRLGESGLGKGALLGRGWPLSDGGSRG